MEEGLELVLSILWIIEVSLEIQNRDMLVECLTKERHGALSDSWSPFL